MSAPGTTRAPWAVSKHKTRRVTASGVIICNAVLRNKGGPKHKTELKDEHEAEANAHLIAASPDLYEALQEYMFCVAMAVGVEGADVLTIHEARDRMDAALKAAQSALAKARGEVA
jgi:hypothetical protein